MNSRGRFALCVVLSMFLVNTAAGSVDLEPTADGMTVTELIDGKLVCRNATQSEAAAFDRGEVPLRVMYPQPGQVRMSAGLQITLLATEQLEANPTAKAAFIRAAQVWESKVGNPVSITIKADFGTSRFGIDYPRPNILGSASGKEFLASYPVVRQQLLANANNAAETSLYNALPVSSVPTNLGSAARVRGTVLQLKTLGFTLPPDAPLPDIGFNSAFPFDFDPNNGISPGLTDFDAVVVHELGHILGFGSFVGRTELEDPPTEISPTIWDLFRFRPGVTLGTFQTAQRPMSSGGEHVSFFGGASLAMSTGRPDATGGDEQQASHWKDDELTGVLIGLMDPTAPVGRGQLTQNDLNAFAIMGYDIVSGNTPSTPVPSAPGSLQATLLSASSARLSWADSTNETGYIVERKVNGGTFVAFSETLPANTISVDVTGLTAGSTYTFRVKATNAAGDSPYSNEASVTTGGGSTGCTASSTVVCLLSNRFRVSIDYVNSFANPPQPGNFVGAKLVAGTQNPDVATFGISSPQAIEVVVRIQDARPFGINRFDIYYGGLTDLAYNVRITDTQTGASRTYTNAAGTVGGGVDRTTFGAVLSGDERITSGGSDSFYDGERLVDAPRAFSSLTKAEARLLASDFEIARAAVTPELANLRVVANAGAGGACSEIEPNQDPATATVLTLGQPCSGAASITDFTPGISVGFTNGTSDNVEDLYKVTLPSSAQLTVTMTFTNSGSDLDVYLFRAAGGSNYDILGQSNGSSTTETFTVSLAAGTYYVGVSAFTGLSNYTVTASAPGLNQPQTPSAPSNLTATPISSSQIRLNWTDNANNETAFIVEASAGGSGFVQVGDPLPANTTTVTITGATPGVPFTFRVKARNGAGDSGYSNQATATTVSNPGPSVCTTSDTVACLLDGRFRVSIDYINAFANPPQPGSFRGAKLVAGSQNPDVATFGISSAQAIEVVVRVQDTRPFGLNRFDVYYGGLTDLEYTVTVTDVQKGTSKTYRNAPGTVGGGVDRSTFTAN